MANVTADLTETYFAGLTDNAKSYMGRLFVKKNGTQYQLGFDSASTTTNYDTTLRNVGDVVLVVMGYDFTANKLSAWFNPDLATFHGCNSYNTHKYTSSGNCQFGWIHSKTRKRKFNTNNNNR